MACADATTALPSNPASGREPNVPKINLNINPSRKRDNPCFDFRWNNMDLQGIDAPDIGCVFASLHSGIADFSESAVCANAPAERAVKKGAKKCKTGQSRRLF